MHRSNRTQMGGLKRGHKKKCEAAWALGAKGGYLISRRNQKRCRKRRQQEKPWGPRTALSTRGKKEKGNFPSGSHTSGQTVGGVGARENKWGPHHRKTRTKERSANTHRTRDISKSLPVKPRRWRPATKKPNNTKTAVLDTITCLGKTKWTKERFPRR